MRFKEIRLLEARLAAAQTPAERIAAAEDHLARMRDQLDRASSVIHGNPMAVLMAKYDLTDAEYRLAQLK